MALEYTKVRLLLEGICIIDLDLAGSPSWAPL